MFGIGARHPEPCVMRRDDESNDLRLIRLQELIQEELTALLRDDVTDPALYGVWITALALSVDYRHARVHYALRGTEDEARRRRADVDRAFARATPFLRARLAEAIETKRVPDLRFVFDAAAIEEDGR
jgi:ribosome-binding factor A